MKRIAIIGAGASGLMAACLAAGPGTAVTVFEKQKKIGRKIAVTGNGRCNLSNAVIDQSRYHGGDPGFASRVFERWGLAQTLDFFHRLGIPTVEKANGRLFPASLQASTMVRLFEYQLTRKNVTLHLHRRIDRIIPQKNNITLETAGHESAEFDAVILSAGSPAYSAAGASDSGYALAGSLGHTIIEPFPSILPINIPLKILHRLEGIKWDCRVTVECDDTRMATSTGELLFTKYGISGPAALDVSRAVNALMIAGRRPRISIDLFPDMTRDSLAGLVSGLLAEGEKKLAFGLIGIMHERMPDVLLRIAGLDPEKRVRDITDAERDTLLRILKRLVLEPGSPRPLGEAVVAAGGVCTDEVDPRTMESRLCKKVYLTGELLDIDGDSGGYNLQFAWSTGAVAAMAQGG